jgi:hypothetical protein
LLGSGLGLKMMNGLGAVEILSGKCEVVVLESPGAKEPELATAFGVFRGLEQIEYFATAWI